MSAARNQPVTLREGNQAAGDVTVPEVGNTSKSTHPTAPNEHDKHSAIVEALDKYMATQDEAIASQHSPFHLCSYHTQLQQEFWACGNPLDGPSVMERFLAEDTSEQYAVFVQPDNGKLSIMSPCTCASNIDAAILQGQMAEGVMDEVRYAKEKAKNEEKGPGVV